MGHLTRFAYTRQFFTTISPPQKQKQHYFFDKKEINCKEFYLLRKKFKSIQVQNNVHYKPTVAGSNLTAGASVILERSYIVYNMLRRVIPRLPYRENRPYITYPYNIDYTQYFKLVYINNINKVASTNPHGGAQRSVELGVV